MKKFENVDCFIGRDVEFIGKLIFHGTVKIDGVFKGEISSAGNLIIGDNGKVEADIFASSIVCSGEFHGNIYGDKVIDIRRPGKIIGNIEAPTIIIEEGVTFKGMCYTHSPKKMPTSNLDIQSNMGIIKKVDKVNKDNKSNIKGLKQ